MGKNSTPNAFYEWIEENGIEKTAKILRTGKATIRYWLSGDFDPRVKQMREIKRITKGKVTYDDIIERKPLRRKRSTRKTS